MIKPRKHVTIRIHYYEVLLKEGRRAEGREKRGGQESQDRGRRQDPVFLVCYI